MKANKMVSKSQMKRSNLHLVFNLIHAHKALSRPRLAALTGMSVMSAGRMVDELLELGLVTETPNREEPTQGRPPVILRVNSEKLLSLGIFLDSDGISVGIVDPYGNINHKEELPCKMHEITVDETVGMMASVISHFQSTFNDLLPVVGISVPGLIDHKEGIVKFSAQLKWRNVPLLEKLKEKLDWQDIVIENDIKAWALAEKLFGVAYPYDTVALLSIGSGLGSAVVIDGNIYRGKNNLAGEIGHIVINPMGRLCNCGKVGCLQTQIAEWALIQEAGLIRPEATIDTIFRAYEHGESWARDIINRMVAYTSIAINLLANTYAPDAIVLCGNMIEQYPIYAQLIEERNNSYANDFMSGTFAICVSDFGAQGSVVGAASIALQKTLNSIIG